MPATRVSFPLSNAYIHHWLVAGPHTQPVTNSLHSTSPAALEAWRQDLARQFHVDEPETGSAPQHLASLPEDKADLRWQFYRCWDDAFINLSAFYPEPHYLKSWAYTEIHVPAATETMLQIWATGPVDVWLNEQHCLRDTTFRQHPGKPILLPLALQDGPNRLLIRFEQLGLRHTAYRLAARLPDLGLVQPPDHIHLPLATSEATLFQEFDQLLTRAQLDQTFFAGSERLSLHWAEALNRKFEVVMRLRRPPNRIFAETYHTPTPGEAINTIVANSVPSGHYQLSLSPKPEQYIAKNLRLQRNFNLYILNPTPTTRSEKAYPVRLSEGLQQAMQQRLGLAGELAAMKLNTWNHVNVNRIRETCSTLSSGHANSLRDLVALTGMLLRYEQHPSFPPELTSVITTAVREFSDDPTHIPAIDMDSEAQQLLAYTAAILTGQRWPEASSGSQTGAKRRQAAEIAAQAWLREKGQYGLRLFLTEEALDLLIFALSHLIDLAEDDLVRDLAAVLLDKVLITVACNSFYGVSRGDLQDTIASLSYLLWGSGAYNEHLWSVVALAHDQTYTFPAILENMARDIPAEQYFQDRQCHPNGTWDYARVTYRTPDFMLTSLQNYCPGQAGNRERIWQAVLNQRAIVRVTHPAHTGQSPVDIPNFLHGQARLPQVHQWQDSLIALYNLSQDDWAAYTQAHIPLSAFDDYEQQGNWFFARADNAYLALTASRSLALISTGLGAHETIRVEGKQTVWVCLLGRRETDGSFGKFQKRVRRLNMDLSSKAATITTLRGDRLRANWGQPFRVNGDTHQPESFPHYDTPFGRTEFPAVRMAFDIQDVRWQLDFSA